jgi:hypothetical protein
MDSKRNRIGRNEALTKMGLVAEPADRHGGLVGGFGRVSFPLANVERDGNRNAVQMEPAGIGDEKKEASEGNKTLADW